MTLRPMTMDDADFMLTLKNYPETRHFAIQSHDEIKKEDHYRWLKPRLIFFQVVCKEADGEPIGCVRVFGGEISIWIDRKYWGLGVATAVIKEVADNSQYDKGGLTAKVVDGNVASLRAFIKAGFLPVTHSAIDKYYLLQR